MATAAKKADTGNSATEKVKPIKYTDKSAGQPQLAVIFHQLRDIFLQFEKGTIAIVQDEGGQTHLYSNKPVEIEGRKKDGLYLASILVQKGYVGFYLMPAYDKVFLTKNVGTDLQRLLKGKTCFHIKKMDNQLKGQVQNAIEAGYKCYMEKGWA
jgi:hypothetical protein